MSGRDDVLDELTSAQTVLVIQGENPDGDSLASALALEEIMEGSGKSVVMYCAVDMPRHLRFLEGWDRVVNQLPDQFDLSIVVDTASEALLERTFTDQSTPILRSKPMVVLDHHDVEMSMPFATTNFVDIKSASTGEVIHNLFAGTDYQISVEAMKMLTVSILYDTRGLSTESTSANTIRLVADFVEAGVSIPELDENRMKMNKRDQDISSYKGELLQRVEVNPDIGLATVHITWEEIEKYSDRYNPAVLVLDEMRLINGVDLAIAYKTYPDGKILAKIRSNRSAPYAAQLAEHFNGGGHPHASGFKLRGRDFSEVQQEVIEKIGDLRGAENV